MTCRCAQMQTLLFDFTLKLPYILLYFLSDDKRLQCKLNTSRDVLNTIPDGLQRIVERYRSIHLFGPR